MMTKKLIVVVGATASGKTALAVHIAKAFNTVVLSADSRQIYKEMSIGTAKPTMQEMEGIPHYFINHRSVKEGYSVGEYEAEAISLLNDLYKTHDTVVMAGGTGLYFDAVCNGLDKFPDISETIREEVRVLYAEKGLTALQDELKIADPLYYETVDLQNPHRLIRALEVCRNTGQPFSSFHQHTRTERFFKVIKIGIDWERDKLYARINRRVELMMEAGLLSEATGLHSLQHLIALQTVGYQEIFGYLNNTISLERAIELIQQNSRRYAKRQLTWLRRDSEIHWFKADNLVAVFDFLSEFE